MATQIGVTRVYTERSEATDPKLVECVKCRVKAVPRGITSTTKGAAVAAGEGHCPNCGHIHGRDNH